MNLDMDSIQYIFQIPKQWYVDVNNVCFKTYPGWLIHIEDGDNGAKEIYVDYDEFKDAVQAIGGSVKSVDGIFPDVTGNINFNLTANKWLISDNNGHITTTDDSPVLSVDGIDPDSNGDIDFGFDGNKWLVTDTDGHIVTTADIPVLSVDGIDPDSNGDIDFGLTGNKWLKSDSNGHITTSNEDPITLSSSATGFVYNTNGSLSYVGYGQTSNTVAQGNHGHGNVNTFGYISPYSGKNANTLVITNESGLMTTSEYVLKEISGVSDWQTIVNIVNAFDWDSSGNPTFHTLVRTVNGIGPTNGNIEVPCVYTVNNKAPDENGNVNVGMPDLDANKWVITDSNGDLTTSNEDPITLSSSATGFVYNTNGSLSYVPFGVGAGQVAVGNHSHNLSALNNDVNFVNLTDVQNYLTENLYTTVGDVQDIVESYNYCTYTDMADYVDDALDDYVTLATVQTITANKYFGADTDHCIEIGGTNALGQIAGIGKPLHIVNETQPIEINVGVDQLGESKCNIGMSPNGTMTMGGDTLTLITTQASNYFSDGTNTFKGQNNYIRAVDGNDNIKGAISTTQDSAQIKFGTGGWITTENTDVKAGIGSNESLTLTSSRARIKSTYGDGIFDDNGNDFMWGPATNPVATRIQMHKGLVSNLNAIDMTAEEIVLGANATNRVKVTYAPTENTTNRSSLVVATCGWVSSNFLTSVPTYEANKWVKTDSTGHLGTTNSVPFVISTTSTGFVYNGENGSQMFIPYGNQQNTVARGNHTHSLSNLNNDVGFVTSSTVNSLIDARHFTTEANVRTIVESYNYTTEGDVQNIVESYQYTTADDVDDIIDSYDFATKTDLNKYVTLNTAQTITATKTFSNTNTNQSIQIGGQSIIHSGTNVFTLRSQDSDVSIDSTSSGNVASYIHVNSNGGIICHSTDKFSYDGPVFYGTATSGGTARLRSIDGSTVKGQVQVTSDAAQMTYGSSGGTCLATDNGVLMRDSSTNENSKGTIEINKSTQVLQLVQRAGNGCKVILNDAGIYLQYGSDWDRYCRFNADNFLLRDDKGINIRSNDGTTTNGYINLNAPVNKCTLTNAPTISATNTTSTVIATCGWVGNNFQPTISLTANKWVKTNSNGKLTVSSTDPITLSSSSTGFLYNTNGTLSYKPFGTADNTVAKGNHTHNLSALNNDAGFKNESQVRTIVTGYGYQNATQVAVAIANALGSYVTIDTAQTITGIKVFGIDANGIKLSGTSTLNEIDSKRTLQIHSSNNQNIKIDTEAKSLEMNSTGIQLTNTSSAVTIKAKTNLTMQSDTAVSTVKGNGVVLENTTGVHSDVTLGSDTARMRSGPYGATVEATSGSVLFRNGNDPAYCSFRPSQIDVDCTGIVNIGGGLSVNLEAPANGCTLENSPSVSPDECSNEVATCGWVDNNYMRKPEDATPITTTKTVVTAVNWNGIVLKYSREQWTFKNGLLTNVTTLSDVTIDTPVAY